MQKTKYLNWFDIILITLLILGGAIYTSNADFFGGIYDADGQYNLAYTIFRGFTRTLTIGVVIFFMYTRYKQKKEFGRNYTVMDLVLIILTLFTYNFYEGFVAPHLSYDADIAEFSGNINSLFTEIDELAVVFTYLVARNFDFSRWKFKITLKDTFIAVGIFILFALIFDAISFVENYFRYGDLEIPTNFHNFWFNFRNILSGFDPTILSGLISFSLLNGFYEEIFFLGILLSVKPNRVIWVFLYSLVIRTSFHTYQGFVSAFGIGLVLGIIYFLLYEKVKYKNLYPYFLSHSFADIFGLAIFYNFFL